MRSIARSSVEDTGTPNFLSFHLTPDIFAFGMKWIRGLIFLPIAAALLVSCSHKAPATRQDRDKWDQSALKGTYEIAGNRNPKWDKDAEDALNAFAQSRTASSDEAEMYTGLAGDAAENAVNEGCNDPMVRYLYIRYSSDARAKPFKERQDLYQTAANNLEVSGYPAIWKFYANVDAAELLWWNKNHDLWQQVNYSFATMPWPI